VLLCCGKTPAVALAPRLVTVFINDLVDAGKMERNPSYEQIKDEFW